MSTEQTELQVRESVDVAQPSSLLAVIAQAVMDPRVDVAKMERLLAMQQAIEKERREVVFKSAMSQLQAKIPQINKYGQGKNSKYSKLEDIDAILRPLLHEFGFSVSLDEESHGEKDVTFKMTVSHEAGHSEVKRLTVTSDTAAQNRDGKSIRPAIQDDGSTVSYARRYLLKMHFNIIEKNEDTDGESKQAISEEQALDLETAIADLKMDKGKFLVFMGVGELKDILARDWKKATNAIDTRRRNPKQ